MIQYNTLIVLLGVSLLAAAAGVVGVFAILRQRALMGDALAHASLAGICLAFMLTGERRIPILLLGALGSGVLGIMVATALRRYTRLKDDAVLGTVLTVFFGLGVVLSRLIQNHFPNSNKAGLDSFLLGKTAGMTRGDLNLIALLACACLLVILLFYKEFKLISFDSGFAATLGWPVYGLDLLLMALVAVAVVIGLPAVGVVLIAALLILPGAAARFWTQRLSHVLILAGIFGLGIGLVGTIASANLDLLPAGPIIVLTGTALFLFSLFAGTTKGLAARWLSHRHFRHEWEGRQLLQTVYEIHEGRSPPHSSETGSLWNFSLEEILRRKSWRPGHVWSILSQCVREGMLQPHGRHEFQLTEFGRRRAVEVVRGLRLWELFLKEHPDLAGAVVNLGEESVTNVLPNETVQELTSQLQAQGRWPQ